MKCRQLVVVLSVIVLVVVLATVSSSPAGAVSSPCEACDPTFGENGLALGLVGLAVGVVVQPDGKTLLLVGRDGLSVAVERLDVDGSPDFLGFGALGVAELSFHQDSLGEYPSAMTLAPDLDGVAGDFDIVVSGWVRLPAASTNTKGKGKKNQNSFTDHMVIARLNSDGTQLSSYDPTSSPSGFGIDGLLMLDADSNQPVEVGIAVDSQGRILAAARFGSVAAVFRVDSNGGASQIFETVARSVGSIAVVSSDYVLGHTVLGEVVRWTDAGTLDPSFGTNGQIDVPGTHIGMAVDTTDGSVVVASVVKRESGKGRKKTRWNEVVVRRYDKDGRNPSPPGFFAPYNGDGGALNFPSDHLYDLKIDPEGKVVAVVHSFDDTGNNLAFEGIVRWNTDGSLELFPYAFSGPSFTGVFSYRVAFNPPPDDGVAPPEYAKNVMVLGGWTSPGPNNQPAAIRMLR